MEIDNVAEKNDAVLGIGTEKKKKKKCRAASV
jgi:hypothetical protein